MSYLGNTTTTVQATNINYMATPFFSAPMVTTFDGLMADNYFSDETTKYEWMEEHRRAGKCDLTIII